MFFNSKIEQNSRQFIKSVASRCWKKVIDEFFDIFVDFSNFTTLHGIRNIVGDFEYLDKLTTLNHSSKYFIFIAKCLSAILWGGAFLIGIYLSFILINLICERSVATPTRTTIDTYYYPIYNVAFPAVTICNINKVYAPALNSIIEQMKSAGYNETLLRSVFSHLSLLSHSSNYNSNSTAFEEYRKAIKHFNYTPERLMLKLMHPCNQMIRQCIWWNLPTPCDKLFRATRTTEGFCCSFNFKSEINQTEGFGYRVSGAGDNIGLNVLIVPEADKYTSVVRTFQGVHVAVHHVKEIADLSNLVAGQPGYDVKIIVTPSTLTADPEVRDLPLSQRNCAFKEERTLDTGDEYSYPSCMVDCRVQHIVKRCNCIPYYYPHVGIPLYAGFEQCNLQHAKCIFENRSFFGSIAPPDDAIGFENVVNKSSIGLTCDDCLPDCRETHYQVQSFISDQRGGDDVVVCSYEKKNSIFNLTSYDLKNVTTLFVGFKDTTCLRYRRSVYMTWDILFASVGGVFGLCLGASTISLIEVLYFFVFRVGGRIFMKILFKDSVTSQSKSNEMLKSKSQITRIYPVQSKGYENGKISPYNKTFIN